MFHRWEGSKNRFWGGSVLWYASSSPIFPARFATLYVDGKHFHDEGDHRFRNVALVEAMFEASIWQKHCHLKP